jgi:hypothetical protein
VIPEPPRMPEPRRPEQQLAQRMRDDAGRGPGSPGSTRSPSLRPSAYQGAPAGAPRRPGEQVGEASGDADGPGAALKSLRDRLIQRQR